MAQNYGSYLIYARRYKITSLLAICVDTDDDANTCDPMFNSSRAQAMPDEADNLPSLSGVSFKNAQLEDEMNLTYALDSKVFQYRDELKRDGFMFRSDKKILARAYN